jgi:transposase
LGTCTLEGLALAAWLAAAGVTHGAMARTGADWKPGDTVLEGPCPVLVGNAAHVKKVPGRKTDQADARWLAQRRREGLLHARVSPPAGQRALRALTRDRTTLVQERRRAVNRVQGVRERAHSKLASGARALMGVAGRALLEALSAGRADPATLAAWARGRRRSKMPLRDQALTGVVRAQHPLVLATQVAPIAFLEEQLEALSHASGDRLHALDLEVPPGVPADPPEDTNTPSAPAAPYA